nr:hypothetical protein [uncultured Lachnoclostridium sp.]
MEQSSETRFDWLVYPIPKPFKTDEEYTEIRQKMFKQKIQLELFADKIDNASSEEEKVYWRTYATMSDENRKKLDDSGYEWTTQSKLPSKEVVKKFIKLYPEYCKGLEKYV